jgi:putative DNA primase/helicase
MFEGWKLYRTEKLKLPEEVRGATELYREVLDVCKDFLKDRIVNDGSDIGSTKLYQAFKSWFTTTHNQHQQPMSQKMFSTRLEQLGYHIERRRDGSCFCGVGRLAQDYPGQDSFIDQPFL